jgi:hypothetical protein
MPEDATENSAAPEFLAWPEQFSWAAQLRAAMIGLCSGMSCFQRGDRARRFFA